VLIVGLTDNWDDAADVGALTLQIDRAVSELAMISLDRSVKRIASAKVRAHVDADDEEAGLSGDDRADELSTDALRLLRAEREDARAERKTDPEPGNLPPPEEDGTSGVGEPIPQLPADTHGVEVDELKGTIK